jgi:hypothetical protein
MERVATYRFASTAVQMQREQVVIVHLYLPDRVATYRFVNMAVSPIQPARGVIARLIYKMSIEVVSHVKYCHVNTEYNGTMVRAHATRGGRAIYASANTVVCPMEHHVNARVGYSIWISKVACVPYYHVNTTEHNWSMAPANARLR